MHLCEAWWAFHAKNWRKPWSVKSMIILTDNTGKLLSNHPSRRSDHSICCLGDAEKVKNSNVWDIQVEVKIDFGWPQAEDLWRNVCPNPQLGRHTLPSHSLHHLQMTYKANRCHSCIHQAKSPRSTHMELHKGVNIPGLERNEHCLLVEKNTHGGKESDQTQYLHLKSGLE